MPATEIYDLARTTVLIAGFLAGIFAIVYSYRKQKVEEANSLREDSKELSRRYQDASAQLGHEQAAVRLAGVYALARLADDWTEQKQQCVDVLCAYIRLSSSDIEKVDPSDEVVRRAIFDQISIHCSRDLANDSSWRNLRIDLSKSVVHDISWFGLIFSELIMDNAVILGNLSLHSCTVRKRMSFSSATVKGQLSIRVSGTNSCWLDHIHVKPGASVYYQTYGSNLVRLYSPSIKIDRKASMIVSVADSSPDKLYILSDSQISGTLRFDGTGDGCETGAIRVGRIKTPGEGVVVYRDLLLEKKDIVKPAISSPGEYKAARFWASEPQVVPEDELY
ncbi:hypothetical protein [Corynebacterium provencense]|uniref:hypothetical protein n=1 Tax=Corynebacterium provencense TaxID=1737425 RepID=UPI0013A61D78|nr:hypothetical protein [Corynebacterium provencense]